MQTTAKRLIACLLCLIVLLGVVPAPVQALAEALPDDSELTVTNLGIQHETEFGGTYLKISVEDFNALGFAFGDSLDITFSNGYTVEGIPYYNGYYTQIGEPLLVGYPGYRYVDFCINSGGDSFLLGGLTEQDLATVTLAEPGKYLSIQQARDIHYQDDRSQYASDVVFANFRAVTVGDIREGMLYRSASPCDNRHNRAAYVDTLMGRAGVQTIIDLADNREKIAGYIRQSDFNSPSFLKLYEQGGVIPLAMTMNFTSDDFKAKLIDGLTAMADAPGPYLVHCTEGKDRTGFVCMVLEALGGADYQAILDDYMITYDNYYGITEQSDPERYQVIAEQMAAPMLRTFAGETDDLASVDMTAAVTRYLEDCGMSAQKIETLRARLTGE